MQKLILLVLLFSFLDVSAQIEVKGNANAYVGKTIQAFKILDFFSNKEELIATTTVNADSTFSLYFESLLTQKIIIRSNNNVGFLLVQPNANYSVDFPEKDNYMAFRPDGNQVEIGFYDLDSNDINYKVLGFQRWVDHFLGNNYHIKSLNPTDFVNSLDRFKERVEKAYINDTSTYFKTQILFTMAGLDNITHAAERNRNEKHDFYLKYNPVSYRNEAYMTYIKGFYQQLMPRLSNTSNNTNEAVYNGILRSSPTLIMKALGSEHTLINLRIRELVMINALTESYNSGEYPQTNIRTILDSLSNRCLFKENAIIAKNMNELISQLTPGGAAPNFVLMSDSKKTKTKVDFLSKYLYLYFFDPESTKTEEELVLLIDLYKKYGENIEFVGVIKEESVRSEKARALISDTPWSVYSLPESNSIWNNYNVVALPNFTLIDIEGYIVASPALGPSPNGSNSTIDKTFFFINKAMSKEY